MKAQRVAAGLIAAAALFFWGWWMGYSDVQAAHWAEWYVENDYSIGGP